MKWALTTAPVLGYADCTKPFILEMDASHDGLSAMLSQEQDGKQRVIAYASQHLRPIDKNSSMYSSMKLEFLAMKLVVTKKKKLPLLAWRTLHHHYGQQYVDLLPHFKFRHTRTKMGISAGTVQLLNQMQTWQSQPH